MVARRIRIGSSGPPGWVLTGFDFDMDFVNNLYWDGSAVVALSTLLDTDTTYDLDANGLSVTTNENHVFLGAALSVLNTIASGNGTLYAEFNIAEGSLGCVLDFSGVGGNRPVWYIDSPGPPTSTSSYYDGTNAPGGIIFTPSTNVKSARAWSGSTISTSQNGATVVSTSWDGNWDASAPSLGEGNAGNVWTGYIRRIAAKTSRLSDGDLQTLTT